jgi:hypothetical protein
MSRRVVIFEFSEVAGERDLLLVGKVLIAKDQHSIFVDARLDRINRTWAEGFPAIDTRDLSGKGGVKWTDRYGHV